MANLTGDKAITNTFINYLTDVTRFLGLKNKNVGLQKPLSKLVENFRNSEDIKAHSRA